MSSFEFFVRLDYIEYQESFVVPKIGFKGWAVVPDFSYLDKIKLDKIKIEPLIFDLAEQRSTFHKGTIASNLIALSKPLTIKYFPTNRNVNAHDSKLEGLQVIFEGEFEAEIPSGQYGVILDASLETFRALSNQWNFTLSPENTRYQARGGFLSPRVSWIKSSYFILAGWAYREGDKIQAVDFIINDKKVENVILGLNSKSLREASLNVRGSEAAVFARIINAKELGVGNLSKWIDLNANVVFKSGENLKLSFSAFRIEPNQKQDVLLESASVGSDGIARISGYSMFGRVGIRTRNGFIELPRNATKANEHFPESITSRSFETGGSLGKLPGFAQIYLKTLDGWRLAKPTFIQEHFRKTLSRFYSKFSVIKGFINQVVSVLMRVRSIFLSAPAIQRAAPSKDRLFIATHNLSAVEGAPKVLLDIFTSQDLGFKEILVISPEDGILAEQWRVSGARVEIVSDSTLVQELVYEFSPGIVFANTISSYWAIALAHELNLPNIWCIHESVSPYESMVNLPHESWMVFAQALLKVNKICFVSEQTQKLYINQCPGISSCVIPNGLEPFVGVKDDRAARAKLNLTERDFVLLCVGTTAYRKGQDLILSEAKLIKERIDKNLIIYFVGARESDFLDLLRVMASELEVTVNFIPETTETELFYLAADLKVIASRQESAPLVSLEALKYGLPIVSTSVFGLAEQLEDRKTCLFFDPLKQGDLTDKVLEVFGDITLRESLINNGLRTVQERFGKSSQLESYRSMISKLLLD